MTTGLRKKVINIFLAWHGSVHDAEVFSISSYNFVNEKTCLLDSTYFEGEQHGIGDSAFPATRNVVPSYKKPHTEHIENVEFNRLLRALKVKVEHVNGMVKSRFEVVREICMKHIRLSDIAKVINFVAMGYVLVATPGTS